MRIIQYLKRNGIKHVWDIIWQYKLDLFLQKLLLFFLRYRPLKDIIMIESHNDFDCNGGAFYDYLIQEGYNEKYKIIWILKHPEDRPLVLPENVGWVPLYRPSLKKAYYVCMAKFFTADNSVTGKVRKEQKSFYLTHGAFGLKKVKGKAKIPASVDYILSLSEKYTAILAEQLSIEYPSKRFVCLGYPTLDILNRSDRSELDKITQDSFEKVFLWMPTFRKGGGFRRNDSTEEQKLGIPLIDTIEQYYELNDYLNEKNALMIIKIHPMQDLDTLKVKDQTNIRVLTGETVKKRGIDNYRLMACSDALISDYSSAAYEYLQLNRPIAYVLSDEKEYKLGFVVDDIRALIAGDLIYSFIEMKEFIQNIIFENDNAMEKRIKLREDIYKYHDDQNCKRLVDFMGLSCNKN
ncbi:MAG: teichoic acid biosynthesis protein TagF [Lachnospiraceae bacterium]|jgi:CDP-glycerol glycerophosphotransferase (TagB/SpsB family)|nr:teichoic acid biosynthesis protein TagF [Lachnospiraceae bacterium]